MKMRILAGVLSAILLFCLFAVTAISEQNPLKKNNDTYRHEIQVAKVIRVIDGDTN